MVTSHPLSSTPRRDPIARLGWIALLIAAVWVNVATYQAPAQAQGAAPGEIIIQATPTPALPTPDPDAPALNLIAPTPIAPAAAAPAAAPAPIDADPVSLDAAPESAPENGAGEAAPVDNSAYIANVGDQAAHSPRGDTAEPPAPTAPPAFETGAILYPDQNIIVIPAESLDSPPVNGPAVAIPPISAAQAAIIGQRQSNSCPDGQTFYPRTGCHAQGSGGAMPGAVGEAKP